jgi:ketosteroid isomerase-like protein
MSENKTTVMKYMEAFHEHDHEKVLACLTEDVIWYIPGMFRIQGKDAFDKEIENDNFSGKPDITVSRLTEENNIVIAEGEVKAHLRNGDPLHIFFCDVFHLRDARIHQLTSYLMNI